MGAGDYVARKFVPNVAFHLVDDWCGDLPEGAFEEPNTGPDWLYFWTPGAAGNPNAGVFGLECFGRQTAADSGYLSLYRVEQVYAATGCDDGATVTFGRSWEALVEYLTSRPGTSVTDRVSAPFGGVIGVAFALHVDQGTVCLTSGAPRRSVLAFPTTTLIQGRSRVTPVWWGEGEHIRVWVVDVDGTPVVAIVGHEGSSAALGHGFVDKALRLIQTLRFVPTG
jgi:hypothetical protein